MVKRCLAFALLASVSVLSSSLSAQDIATTVQKDVVFSRGDDYQLKLDIAYPTHPAPPRPTIVYIHGNWEDGNRNEFDMAISSAADKGYVATTIDYRPIHEKVGGKPRYPFPSQVCDVWAAVEWLRTNANRYNVDTSRIGAVGYSSGAYLALVAGLASPRDPLYSQCSQSTASAVFKAIVNLAGITDVVDKYHTSFPQMMVDLFGGSPEQLPALYHAASPVNLVSPSSPPILTIHGDRDPYVPLREALSLDRRMKELGKTHTLIVEKNGFHYNLWYTLEVWNFLNANLRD